MFYPSWRYIWGSIFTLLFTACNSRHVSTGSAVNPFGWGRDEVKRVVFKNTDTAAVRDIAVFFAYSESMLRTDTLTIEIEVRTPDSLSFAERVPVVFPACAAVQSACVYIRPYRLQAVFGREGEYSFSLRHLNGERIRGIRSVGIEITETEDGER